MVHENILVVVDMQNDFIDGTLGTKEAESIVEKVAEKIKAFNGILYFTQDTHPQNYLETAEGKKLPVRHCIQGTKGHQLHPIIEKLRLEKQGVLVEKQTFGSVDLAELLRTEYREGPISIELVGLCTDICVISNALILKAYFPETKIVVTADCCAGVTPESHNNALEAMKMCQIDIN